MNSHEDYQREHAIELPSEKSFGLVMAGFFAAIGIFRAWKRGSINPVLFLISAAFLAAAFFRPQLLKTLNILWAKFGLLLGKVMTPIVMGIIFFLVVSPLGIFMRMLGKDPLQLEFEPDLKSYWIARNPPGPKAESMRQQF